MINRFNISRQSVISVTLWLACILPASCTLWAQGVAKSPLRTITANELVFDMKIGWNLGNTLDAPDGETTWGNPTTTQAMLDAVKNMGFKTVRIPVTWDKHMGGAPNYTIDKNWLDRVETIVNYVLRDSMYAIVNTHHDEWVKLTAPDTTVPMARLTKLWSQIATRFKDYSDYLVFETLNEPRQTVNEWNGGTPEARSILNAYHQAAVSAIRATGGNNTSRFIMICGHSAAPTTESVKGITIPNNNDPRCIISLHTYFPQDFSFAGNVSAWGSTADLTNAIKELDREMKDVALKGSGTAVIGEWGSVDKNNLSSRVAHAEAYAREVRSRGMLPVWWDNGGTDFGILNRKANPPTWVWPTIAQALVRGANSATPLSIAKDQPVAKQPSKLSVRPGVIRYTLPAGYHVSLRLYSMQGELVTTFVNATQPAGNYSIPVPERTIAPGSYLLEMKSAMSGITQKITIFR